MRILSGIVTQDVADGSGRVTRSTGIDLDTFQAIIVRKVVFNMDITQALAWTPPSGVDLSVWGESGTHARVSWANLDASGVVQTHYEFVPQIQARAYDEELTIDLETDGTGVVNSMNYTIFYDVVPGSEMEKTQAAY